MAKKKRKSGAGKAAPGNTKAVATKKHVNAPTDAAKGSAEETTGGGWAFLLGVTGVLGLVMLFFPWFRPGGTDVYGYQILTAFDQVPESVQAGFQRVNDTLYMLLVILTGISAAVIGFAWPRLNKKVQGYVGNFSAVIAVGALIEAIILLLVLLNMKAKPHADLTGTLAAVALFGIGFFSLMLAATVDKREGRTDGALPVSDWAIWLGGLGVGALLHYQYICYGLVQKAPEALITKLRTFR